MQKTRGKENEGQEVWRKIAEGSGKSKAVRGQARASNAFLSSAEASPSCGFSCPRSGHCSCGELARAKSESIFDLEFQKARPGLDQGTRQKIWKPNSEDPPLWREGRVRRKAEKMWVSIGPNQGP